MKKIFILLSLTALLAACNNEKKGSSSSDQDPGDISTDPTPGLDTISPRTDTMNDNQRIVFPERGKIPADTSSAARH